MLEREILANQTNPFLVRLYHSFQELTGQLVMEYYPGWPHMHERREGIVHAILLNAAAPTDEDRARYSPRSRARLRTCTPTRSYTETSSWERADGGPGHVAVTDFGAAKQLPREPGALGKATVVGTPAYAAPETCSTCRTASPATGGARRDALRDA